MSTPVNTERYAKVIEVSKRVRWDIERDLIRGRRFDYTKTFLPSRPVARRRARLPEPGRQAAARARCRAAPMPTSSASSSASSAPRCWRSAAAHALGDQVALEALVRMTDEELKHQELFRRLEAMMAADMPAGYVMTAEPNAVAEAVLARQHLGGAGADAATSSCSRRRTTAPASSPTRNLSELWKDVFLFHWKEESQHAILDELELVARGRQARRGRSATPRSTT